MRFADRFGLTCGPLVLRMLLAATFLWTGLGKVLSTIEISPVQAAKLAQMGVSVTPNTLIAPGSTTDDPQLPTILVPDPEQINPAEPETENTQSTPTPLEEVSWNWQPTPTTPPTPTTADPEHFPEGGTVRALHSISLLIDKAANPGLDDESNLIRPIWPSSMAGGAWPVTLAWMVTIAELSLGLMLLIGLLTRLAALGLMLVMGTASWLTVIGPAIQGANPALGFLPNHDVFDIDLWQPFAWQLSLLAASLAVFCLGSGPIGFDRALFRKREIPLELDPNAIPGAQDMDAPRGPFDRSVEDDQS